MMKTPLLVVVVVLLAGCGSSDSPGAGSAGSSGNASCPVVSGSWKVTAHCDPSLVGSTLVVTQAECALSFAAPFNAFSGHLAADGQITLTGPQSCTGTATASAIAMTCTPGTCTVKLAR